MGTTVLVCSALAGVLMASYAWEETATENEMLLLSMCALSMTSGLRLAVRELDNSPLAAPCPLPRAILCAATFCLLELVILTLWQSDDNVSLARAECEDAEVRTRAHGSDGFCEGCGRWPFCLLAVSLQFYQTCWVELTSAVNLR